MPFVAPRTADAGAQGLLIGLNKTDLMRIAELLVLGVVAVLVLLMVVRPLLGRLLEVDEDPAEAAPGMLPAGAGHPALAGPDGSAYPRLPADPAQVVATRVGDAGRPGQDVATEHDQMIDPKQMEGRLRAAQASTNDG